jgi:hypothetical protein
MTINLDTTSTSMLLDTASTQVHTAPITVYTPLLHLTQQKKYAMIPI